MELKLLFSQPKKCVNITSYRNLGQSWQKNNLVILEVKGFC